MQVCGSSSSRVHRFCDFENYENIMVGKVELQFINVY
jgi:hypothetical protein